MTVLEPEAAILFGNRVMSEADGVLPLEVAPYLIQPDVRFGRISDAPTFSID
jgi:hypothetical protein